MHGYGESDSLGSNGALVGAADWIGALLTGSIAITVATLAIAAVGFLMLTGRVPVGRAGPIVLGCFILFSAQVIGRGLAGLQHDGIAAAMVDPTVARAPALAPAYQPTTPRFEQKDPFAGAAVPPPEKEILE